jgi:hypothetical protein
VLVDVDADRPGETTSIEVEGESTLGLTTGVVAAATPFGGVPGVLRGAIRRRQNGETFSGKAAPVSVLVRRVVEDGVRQSVRAASNAATNGDFIPSPSLSCRSARSR